MSINKQIFKKIKRLFLYPFWLIIGSSVIIAIFSWLYYKANISEPLKYSLDVYIGNVSIDSTVYSITITEIIIKYIFSMTFIAEYLIKFIEPINPIVSSEFFIYDENTNELKFRYWIMLPNNEFLYNLHMRVLALSEKEKTSGEGVLDNYSSFVLKDSTLEMARGVRIAKLVKSDKDYPQMLLEILKTNKEKSLYFIISATTENGKIINYVKEYNKNDLLRNCEFVPIRSTSFYPELESKLFFRYHHFDKACLNNDLKNNVLLSKDNYLQDTKYFMTEKEIKVKKYGSRKYMLKDLYSEIISWYLNR